MRLLELSEAVDRILYLAGDGNYTRVHFSDGQAIVFSRTIRVVMAELPGFIRIHRGYAVNPHFVTHLQRPDPKTLELIVSTIPLPVSRRRQSDVRRQLSLFAYTAPSAVVINPLAVAFNYSPGLLRRP